MPTISWTLTLARFSMPLGLRVLNVPPRLSRETMTR